MAKTAYMTDDIFLSHDTGWGHPECAERIKAINSAIEKAPYYKKLTLLQPFIPDLEIIETIHSKNYILRVKKEINSGTPHLDSMDTAVCIKSYEVALRAVGGSIALCDEIMNGDAIHGFGTLRPPGHHAEYDYAAGFCIFNNIAIAAKYLQNKYSIKKIAIIDWDVHHGNGTQHSFEKDDTVLYISLHQFPHYPGTGSKHETGKSKGEGFTLNFPMAAGSGDREYLDIFNMEIIPALISFKPEVILISAGFDAHKSDPLSSIKLSTETYGTFTKMLIDVADTFSEGRIIGLLEGGYNLNILGECVNEVISAFVNH